MINKLEKVVLLFCLLVMAIHGKSQSISYTQLDKVFSNYEVLEMDTRAMYKSVSSTRNGAAVSLKINEQTTWNLTLENSGILMDEYFITEATASGLVRKLGTRALPMQGYVVGQSNSRVSLTFNQDFIYGFIKLGATTYFIEPVSHFVPTESPDKFVLYSINDILPSEEKVCGYDKFLKEKDIKIKETHSGTRMTGLCFRVEIALAADYLMFQTYGSSTGVQNHNIGVLNNVQTNYDDEFADELQFILTDQFLSTCSTCDPWTSSTDPYDLLDEFTAWGINGFNASHDVASLWSKRNFDSSTIGLAWVGTVCTGNKYNVLEDFSTNAAFKRVLQAHELGHNFDASHNSGIMAPSVSAATNWSATSVSEIQSYYNSVSCFDNCPSSNAPTPDFSYNVNNPCSPAEVQFNNLSTNSTSWSWTFDGGIPATSTAQNPIVTFVDGGAHDVTLVAINGSNSNTITIPTVINVLFEPVSEFVYNINGLVVNFIYTGSGATSYLWDFGDGTATSNSQNPTHSYLVNGVYDVTLTVTNQCGTNTVVYPVEIYVIPFVNFTSNITTGCHPQTVSFTNLSSNAATYLWTFAGGTPSTSTEPNPTVTYANPGIYTVTLEATNNAGSNVQSKVDYITISPSPTAGFTFTQNGAQVVLNSTAQHANTLSWAFGDGITSSETNPNYTYQDNGSYTLTQTVTNSCGTNVTSQQVVVAIAPTSTFTSSYQGAICAGETVGFTNTSAYSPSSFLWTFAGGTPATSTEPNPVVTYGTAGVYDVTFSATNANGTTQTTLQNYVTVNGKPNVTFSHLGDGLEVDFDQTISNGTGPTWNFGDGQTSTGTDPTHIYAAEGTYAVSLTDTNGCGTTTYVQNVLVQLLPTANFSTANTTVCNNATVQYQNQSSPSVTGWVWSFEGGTPSTSTEQNPSVTYTQTGNYNVSLTVTNASGQNTVSISDYINVITAPLATFNGAISGNVLTLNNTASYTNTSSWNIMSGTSNAQLTGNQVTYTALSNGVYDVILTNTNQCGQAISERFQYTISAYPVASFTVNDGSPACLNNTVNYEAPLGETNSYSWTFQGGQPATSSVQDPSVTYASAGTYTVVLIVTNAYGADTLSSTVEVGGLPTAEFDMAINDNNVQFNFLGSGQSSQIWHFGDGTTSNELNPAHTYTASGTYTISLVTVNSCGNDTINKNISVIVSSLNSVDLLRISLRPNPATDFVTLDIKNAISGDYILSLVDMSGKEVIKQNLNLSGNQTETLRVSDLASGLYIVKLIGGQNSKTFKLFVTR